ncbi:hypothetical protein G9A89_015211 [Geosiphon pyriformis]|nr:hypothetical protein G9A89_015211 [Geosiphon pyriformis]
MARVANIPYCFPQNNTEGDVFLDDKKEYIIGHFRGRCQEMTRLQWEKRQNILYKKESVTGARLDGKLCHSTNDPTTHYVIEKVITLSQKVSGSKIKLIFTGHGIGGAYALNMALSISLLQKRGILNKFQLNRKIETQVITFGQPRMGNSKFVELVQRQNNNIKIYRVTNGNDYVSQLPKKSKDDIQYWHTDTEYWIPGSEDCDCGSIGEKKKDDDLYRVYQCPSYFPKSQKRFGENLECNAGTDGSSNLAHYGPWFGTTFGNCQNFFPVK